MLTPSSNLKGTYSFTEGKFSVGVLVGHQDNPNSIFDPTDTTKVTPASWGDSSAWPTTGKPGMFFYDSETNLMPYVAYNKANNRWQVAEKSGSALNVSNIVHETIYNGVPYTENVKFLLWNAGNADIPGDRYPAHEKFTAKRLAEDISQNIPLATTSKVGVVELASTINDNNNGITGPKVLQPRTARDYIDLHLRKSGGTVTGIVKFNDNVHLQLGSAADLSIYHNSSNNWNYITTSQNLQINASAVNLYHGGSRKLYTTTSGIQISGSQSIDGALSVVGNITGANLITGGNVDAQHGQVRGQTLVSDSTIVAGSTITAASGLVTNSGNIVANNGSLVVSGNVNAAGGTFSADVNVRSINASANVIAQYGTVRGELLVADNYVSAGGRITSGSYITAASYITSSSGNITAANGSVIASANVYANGGRFLSDGSPVYLSHSGNNSGVIYIRPNGENSSANEFYIPTSGPANLRTSLITTHLNTGSITASSGVYSGSVTAYRHITTYDGTNYYPAIQIGATQTGFYLDNNTLWATIGGGPYVGMSSVGVTLPNGTTNTTAPNGTIRYNGSTKSLEVRYDSKWNSTGKPESVWTGSATTVTNSWGNYNWFFITFKVNSISYSVMIYADPSSVQRAAVPSPDRYEDNWWITYSGGVFRTWRNSSARIVRITRI